MLKRIALASVGVVLVIGLTACGPLVSKEAMSAAGSAASNTTPATTRHNLGDTVDVGGVQVQVKGVQKLPVGGADTPRQANSTFIAVDLAVTNGSSQDQEIGALVRFSVKDAQGHLGNPTIHSRAKNPPAEQLTPGAKTSGQLVYVVPENAKGLQFTYDATPLGGGLETWAIGDAAQIR